MYLPLVLALMTAMTLVIVIGPLMRALGRAPARPEFDRAVYRDQLRELERDRVRGLIGDAEIASARVEIERRMLSAERAAPAAPEAASAAPRLAVGLAVLLACGAGAVYLAVGAPGLPDQPAALRVAKEVAASSKAEQAIAALEQRVAENPKDGQGWALLAQAEANRSNWDKAADAYRHAAALVPDNAALEAALGETLVLQASGVVTPAAAKEFKSAAQRDPKNGIARYYLALADAQEGRTKEAIAEWQKLAAESPENAPVRAALRRRIDEAAQAAGIPAPPLAPPAAAVADATPPEADGAAAPGPDAAQMAAAAKMSPAERQKMVQGMVDRLAAEMQAKPDDLKGWLRLARAYGVLGEHDKAAAAYEHAAALDPKDVNIPLGEIDALLAGAPPHQAMPSRVTDLLKKAAALSPEAPGVLWYQGLNAAQEKKPDEAAGYWRRLLAALPANAPERQTVNEALAALKTP